MDLHYEEEEYHGETAHRGRLMAVLLTALHPSLGYLYVGRTSAAWAAALFFLFYLAGFLALWASLQFFPLLPMATFATGWVLIALMCLWDILREVDQEASPYLLRGYNHPVIYTMVYVFAAIVPAYSAWFIATHSLWSVVKINDSTMYPSLMPGDMVLVDNLAYQLRAPLRGQEVVTEQAEGHVAVGRVVGLPGDLVQLRGDELLVNDSPLPRFVLEGHSEQALVEEIGLGSQRLLIEENDLERYVIATRPGPPPQDSPALTVEEDQVLVTSDNRTQPGKLALRRVPRGRILGKPRYILYSGTQPEPGDQAQARWDRVGLRLQ